MDSLQHKSAEGQTPEGSPYRLTQMDIHKGLLPRPDDLEKYERIHPGLANRMMSMAESEQKHRQDREAEIVSNNFLHQKRLDAAISRGQWFAMIVVLIVAGLSGFAIYSGFGSEGRWIACTVIVAAIVAFVGGKIKQDTRRNSEEE